MQLPAELIASLEGINGFNREALEKVHQSGEKIVSIRLNPVKPVAVLADFPILTLTQVPWAEQGRYLETRPSFTFDPLFHSGCYYVQEASSMFLEQALKQSVDLSHPLKVLDLAAAPGGKSTHIQSLMTNNSMLVSNEVIRARSYVLRDNMIKWGGDNAVVTTNDPKDFGALQNYFDVIVVDAPCSGSGLFRRNEEAIGEWSRNSVQLCSQRQQRILANVWPALKNEGILVYATCSFSREEDEVIVEWMQKELGAVSHELRIDNNWNIIPSNGGYRFWPDKVKGEGFFLACLRKISHDESKEKKSGERAEKLAKNEMDIVQRWVKKTAPQFVKNENRVYAIGERLLGEIPVLKRQLHVTYFGTEIGELIRGKLIPSHSLAMSNLINDEIQKIDLDKEQAIRYLQKKELAPVVAPLGWNLITFGGRALGWANVLRGRINNYYPRELRILKDI